MEVFWAYLLERSLPERSACNVLDIAEWALKRNCIRIVVPYVQTCAARNEIVRLFLENSRDPNDVVVMLDCDQIHPVDVMGRLVADDVDVVAALSQNRAYPYDGMFFQHPAGDESQLKMPKDWPEGLIECEAVASGAIAIRRRVFGRLDEIGYTQPYFQYWYTPGYTVPQTEDLVFCRACRRAGIKVHVDMRIVSPHLTGATTTPEMFFDALKKDPTLAEKYL